MKKLDQIIYILDLILFSFLIFLNVETYIPTIKTPEYLISATEQKNSNSEDNEVWIVNLKNNFFNKNKNWTKKNGYYYSTGQTENYLIVKNQETIKFIKHPWSGFVSIKNLNTQEEKTFDLYSKDSDYYTFYLDKTPINNTQIIITKIILFSLILLTTHFLIKLMCKIKFNIKIKNNFNIKNKTIIILVALFSLIPFIYLIAFYPGLLSPDSLNQWKQLSIFQFNDAHPIFHTFLCWLITRIYHSPISISIFQIICLSIVWMYGVLSILKNFKPNFFQKILILIISFIFFIIPQNGLMSISLWKDVLFSYSILFLTINLFNIIFDSQWIKSNKNQILLITSLALVYLLRHNGIITVIATITTLIIVYKTKFLKSIIVSIILIILIKYPLLFTLKVKKIELNNVGIGYEVNYLNSYVYNNNELKEKYKNLYKGMYPEGTDTSIIYNSYCINYSVTGLDYLFLQNHEKDISKFLKEEIKNNPTLIINEIFKRSSLIWQIKQPSETYTYTTALDDYDSKDVLKEKYNINSYNPNSKLSFFFRKLIYLSESEKYKSLFWRPALNLIFTLFISLYLIYKNKKSILIMPIIPIISLSLGLFLTIPGQDYRYLYANLLVFMFYLLISAAINKKWRKKS